MKSSKSKSTRLDDTVEYLAGNGEPIAQCNGAEVKLKVQDCGECIAVEKIEHVFDRFYRDDDSITLVRLVSRLSIAESLMDAMNDSISLSSAPDEGTIVQSVFPATTDSQNAIRRFT